MFLRQFFGPNLGSFRKWTCKNELLCPSPWKFGPNSCLTNKFLHYEFQLSMLSSLKFSLWKGQFVFGGAGACLLPPKLPNLVQTVVSQITFYIISFKFLCWEVQKFHFGRAIFWGKGKDSLPLRTPKFGRNSCLTNNFLMSFSFLPRMLSSSKCH